MSFQLQVRGKENPERSTTNDYIVVEFAFAI
jgi:hypothetical protein